jgi:hypothetical protein
MGKGITMHKQDPTTVLPKGILPSETQQRLFDFLNITPVTPKKHHDSEWNTQILKAASEHLSDEAIAVIFLALGGKYPVDIDWFWEISRERRQNLHKILTKKV